MVQPQAQFRPLAPSLTITAVQNDAEGTTTDLILTYSPNSVLSLGGVVFRLPEGFTATTNDTINNSALSASQISEGGRKVTLPLTLNLLGIAQFTLQLKNKTLPAEGIYSFSAENTVLIIGSLLPATTELYIELATFAYVTNFLSNNISPINRTSNTVSEYIPAGAAPLGIAITPNGKLIYICNSGENSVSVIRTENNSELTKIQVGAVPYSIVITPNGNFAYVANQQSSNVYVINTQTNAVIKIIPVGLLPSGLDVSPDGQSVYVVNTNSNNISIIDTSTKTILQNVDTGQNPLWTDSYSER
ncbi:beta-propeller fold lactonase family protein [Bacillus atrophaeus]|uniref:BslA/BslB family hydrophobin n=1 Tax=Bacillus atrophaeus TaxID=1452 RepID=UPI002E1B5712|nr:beta-propeller fold lactonase family protein [Bacillus atrophaeus]MED4821069.1 beta-propeller fold lactonase family protein [Bacillus atrophaeus]